MATTALTAAFCCAVHAPKDTHITTHDSVQMFDIHVAHIMHGVDEYTTTQYAHALFWLHSQQPIIDTHAALSSVQSHGLLLHVPAVAAMLAARSREDYIPPDRPLLSKMSDPTALSYLAPPRPMSADTARMHRMSQGSGPPSKGFLLQDIMEDAPLEDAASSASSPSKRSGAHQASNSPPGKRAAVMHAHAAVISSDDDEEVVAEEVEDEEGPAAGDAGEHDQGSEDGEEEEGQQVGASTRPRLSQSSIHDELATSSGSLANGHSRSYSHSNSHKGLSHDHSQSQAGTQEAEPMVFVVPTHPTHASRHQQQQQQAMEESRVLVDHEEDDEGDGSGSEAASSAVASTRQPSELTDYGELLHPHQFAVQLLAHDLLTLPAHQPARSQRTSGGGSVTAGAGGVSGALPSRRGTGSPPARVSYAGVSEAGSYAAQAPVAVPPHAHGASSGYRHRPMSAPSHRGVVNSSHAAFVDHGFSTVYAPKRGPYSNPTGGTIPPHSASRARHNKGGGGAGSRGGAWQRPASAGPWSRPSTRPSHEMAAAGSLAPSEADDQVDVVGALSLGKALRQEQRRHQKRAEAAVAAAAILSDDGEGDEDVERIDGSDGEVGGAAGSGGSAGQQAQVAGGKPVKWSEWYSTFMAGMATQDEAPAAGQVGAAAPRPARPSTAPSTGRQPVLQRPQSARPMYGPRHSNQQYAANYESPYSQHYVSQFYGGPMQSTQPTRIARPASAQPRPKPPPSASAFDLGMGPLGTHGAVQSVPETVRASGTAAVDVAGVTVSVYVAETMKRVVEANRWMAALGLRNR